MNTAWAAVFSVYRPLAFYRALMLNLCDDGQNMPALRCRPPESRRHQVVKCEEGIPPLPHWKMKIQGVCFSFSCDKGSEGLHHISPIHRDIRSRRFPPIHLRGTGRAAPRNTSSTARCGSPNEVTSSPSFSFIAFFHVSPDANTAPVSGAMLTASTCRRSRGGPPIKDVGPEVADCLERSPRC